MSVLFRSLGILSGTIYRTRLAIRTSNDFYFDGNIGVVATRTSNDFYFDGNVV
jgi:hypothetical protein